MIFVTNLDSFDLVDLVLIRQHVEHSEHGVEHGDDLHTVALGADVAEHRDVVEDDGDHLEHLARVHGAGALLDLLGHGLGHHLAEQLVAPLHLVVELHHGLLHQLRLLHLGGQGVLQLVGLLGGGEQQVAGEVVHGQVADEQTGRGCTKDL